MPSSRTPRDVRFGKFELLATVAYAEAVLQGKGDAAARERGIIAAVMGAQARQGRRGNKEAGHDLDGEKTHGERPRPSTLTADAFDRQVADKLGGFFRDEFYPAVWRLVEAGLDYNEIKRVIGIPPRWGAKLSASQFRERVAGPPPEPRRSRVD